MITAERKSKYKYKVTVSSSNGHRDMIDWCTKSFGKGGRRKTLRWRFGWTGSDNTFYFKNGPDATMFVLKWSGHEKR